MMLSPQIQKNDSFTSGSQSTFEEKLIEIFYDVDDLDPLREERIYFESIRSELRNKPNLKDQYVAILHNEIIGNGKNGAKLAIEMYKEHGYIPIFIEKVNEDVSYITSPRLE